MSSFLSIDYKDLAKGAFTAALAAGTVYVTQWANSGVMPNLAQVKIAALAAFGAGFAYVIKNFITNSENKLGLREPVVPVELIVTKETPDKAV